ncbi:MAG: ABC transporter permease, partial [Ignavibacteriaceae bacterium]
MLKNYFKIAARNIFRNKTYSIINIFGLSIGIACSILIILWVHYELSFDRFHKNSSDLFIVAEKSYSQNEIEYGTALPYPAAQELKRDYPEILDVSRVYYSKEILFVHNDKRFIENQILMVDPEFLTMFSFPLIHGDANSVLNDPNSVVITKKIAQKYFGNANPVGKTFRVDNQYDLIVTGVLDDIPHNSHLDFSILVPLSSELIINQFDTDRWQYTDYGFSTYVLLPKNQNYKDVSKKIATIMQKHIKDCRDELSLYPITKLHTNPDIAPPESRPIDMKYINIFIVIAFLVLLIGCINFMNLSTARSTIRAQEIGIRKVVGSNRSQLITQFLGESLLLTLIAGLLSLLTVELMLPFFNRISGTPLTIDYSNVGILLSFGAIILFVGIVAGSYPAFYLSAFRPITVLKGNLMVDYKNSRLRKIFVVVQFSLSICFIIGAIVFYEQLNYMKNKEVGYDKDNLISVPMDMLWGQSLRSYKYDTFK